jgi:hypothetical protein
MAHIAGQTSITFLRLNGLKGVTDAGLVHIKDMSRLNYLTIRGAGLTDASVPTLKALPGLKKVELDGNKFTADGIKQLRQSRPDMTVVDVYPGANSQPTGNKEIKK